MSRDKESSNIATIIIDGEFHDMRLDRFLKDYLQISHHTAQKILRKKQVKLNNRRTIRGSAIISQNDTVTIFNINQITGRDDKAKADSKNLQRSLAVRPKPLITKTSITKIIKTIIYKDDNIIAVNKPHGLATQGGSSVKRSLADFLPHLKFDLKETPRLVHRLDKHTSGLILIARHKKAAEILTGHFKNKSIAKTYIAAVKGSPVKKSDTISKPLIKKYQGKNEKISIDYKHGKEAITKYQIIASEGEFSIARLQPITGRTHQLRVHMKEIGHPIIGDGKYGGKSAFLKDYSNKLHLHSHQITIKNFFGKKELTLKAQPPEHIADTLKKSGVKI